MKSMRLFIIVLALLGVGALSQAQPADAAFHIMRVYGVMGGAGGNTNIQYVELRMPTGGQNFVQGHQLCFYDAAGNPTARFTFPTNADPVPGGPVESAPFGASILIGSSDFDLNWPSTDGGNTIHPDFLFTGNTIGIPSGLPVTAPVVSPAGKVAFGDFTSGCANSSLFDSIAYGVYTAMADHPPRFTPDLTISGTHIIKLTGALVHPGANNCSEYSRLNANAVGGANNPRNILNQSGQVSAGGSGTDATCVDTDSDGVMDASDNCPAVANGNQVNGDGDTLGNACDNCAAVTNQTQTNSDADTLGNACDNCPTVTNQSQANGDGDTFGDLCDNCPTITNQGQESADGDAYGDVCDNCPTTATLWFVPPGGDTDCDGFTTTVENHVGTDPNLTCGANTWPPDFVGTSNVTDFSDLSSMVPRLFQSSGASDNVRWDLVSSPAIDFSDLSAVVPFLFRACLT